MKPIPLRAASLALAASLTLAGCATLFGPTNPYAVDRKGELVEYNYAWSAEASAVPVLVRRLQSDLETLFTAATSRAEADRAAARAANRPFVGHQFNRRWTTAGQSPRLLSLYAETLIFTGGASPSHGADALIWDRLARREVKPERLFSGSLDKLLQADFCRIFDAERSRRGAPAISGDCPQVDKLAVVPADSDGDRRFDRFRLVAPHGVAGGHAEGRYDIALAVTPRIRAALRPAYRSSFEVQPQ